MQHRSTTHITRSQVAARLECSVVTVRRLQAEGTLVGARGRDGVFWFDAAHVSRLHEARMNGESENDARGLESERRAREAQQGEHDAQVRADERARVLAETSNVHAAAPTLRERLRRRFELSIARHDGGRARRVMQAVHELRDVRDAALSALHDDPHDEEAHDVLASVREVLGDVE